MNRIKILIPIILFTVIAIILLVIFNYSVRYNRVIIDEATWNEIISTRTESQELSLKDIEFNDYNLIIDETNSKLYYSIINESKNKYNPKISYTVTDKNAKIAVLSEEITEELVKSNYEFKVMIYTDKEYHIYTLVCTDLPILNISYKDEVKGKQKNIPMEIYLFDNLTNLPDKITTSEGRLKINENNYTFSLNMITPGNNRRDNKISILNMKPNSEYVLTEVNNEEQVPNNHRMLLFINNEYKGIYSLGHIGKEPKKK